MISIYKQREKNMNRMVKNLMKMTKNKELSTHNHGCFMKYFMKNCKISHFHILPYMLLKSDVTRRDHVVHCHGSQECWFTLCQFRCQFHSWRHSLRITLKSTTLVDMRSRYAWTTKSWQRSKWRLGFNSIFLVWFLSIFLVFLYCCLYFLNCSFHQNWFKTGLDLVNSDLCVDKCKVV